MSESNISSGGVEDSATVDPQQVEAAVEAIVSEQDALVAGFYSFEEMIWKRINEQEDDQHRTAVSLWISKELERVQATVSAVAHHEK